MNTNGFISHVLLFILIILFLPFGKSLHRGSFARYGKSFYNNLNADKQSLRQQKDPFSMKSSFPKSVRSKTFLDDQEYTSHLQSQFADVSIFLSKAALVGATTGLSVVCFKTAISMTSSLFYENLAAILPKPSFYWPLVLYPLIGSLLVSLIVLWRGDGIRNGIDAIARSIDASTIEVLDYNSNNLRSELIPLSTETPVGLPPEYSSIGNSASTLHILQEENDVPVTTVSTYNSSLSDKGLPNSRRIINPKSFDPLDQFARVFGAVFTLGSGCSLGPEGPSVEIGAGWSRLISGNRAEFKSSGGRLTDNGIEGNAKSIFSSTAQERHHLFLAGTAAGVAAGFNAPISGVFFAIECGNRYLSKNTIKLDENSPDGPRADIAAIVLSAAIADIIVGLGLHEKDALSIQGNSYAMVSPFFEMPMYMILGLICGAVSVTFSKLRDYFTMVFAGESQDIPSFLKPLSTIPKHLQPIAGGMLCGIVALFVPQTLFVGYATLDQLLAGKIQLELPLILELLGLKLLLSSFSLGSGLIGGVFAPSLFFGATVGTAYHTVISNLIDVLTHHLSPAMMSFAPFFKVANAPAYATVGAAAVLGALFRAPLTSSMLMFELTQNHDIVLPVLVSTGLGGLFAELLSSPRRLW